MPLKTKVTQKIKFVSGTEENLKRKIRKEMETNDLEKSPKTMVQTILKLGPKTRNTEILKSHPSFVYRCGSAVLNERHQMQEQRNMDVENIDVQNMDVENIDVQNMDVDPLNDSNAMEVESPEDPTALPMEIIPGLDSSNSTNSSLPPLPSRRHSSSSSDDFNGESMEMFCFEHLRPEAEYHAESDAASAVEEMDVDFQDDGFDALDNNIDLVGSLDESTMEGTIEIENMLKKYYE